jgi:hypothetical protein
MCREEVCELGGAGAGECGAEVGDGREQCFDLFRLRCVGAPRFELAALLVERGALSREFLDARLGGGDDGVGGVVVLFEAERLSADRLVDVGEPSGERAQFRRVGCRGRSAREAASSS